MGNHTQEKIRCSLEQSESQTTMLKQEINRRKQLEKQLTVVTQELEAVNAKMASYKQNMEERIRFDILLSDISAHFINMPPDQVDSKILDVQTQVCELLGLDLSALWQWSKDDKETLILTHLYRPLGGPPIPDKMNANDFFPWARQELRAGRRITVSSMDNLPPEAARDRESWSHYGVKASAIIPLKFGGESIIGGISFSCVKSERTWSETILERLQLISQIIANALARKFSNEALREGERRLGLATDAAEAGIWSYELSTGKIWASKRTRELFHFSTDKDLDYDTFLKRVLPEDREEIHAILQQASKAEGVFQKDYRIILNDGNIRWINSRGSRYMNSAGDPENVMGVSIDVTERKQIESRLRENLDFERLLTDISAHFVNLLPGDVDSEIEEAQRRVCEFLGLDVSALWQWSGDDPGVFQLTHLYRPSGGPPVPDRIDAIELFPWGLQQIMAGKIIPISSMENIPPEAIPDLDAWRYFGLKTDLTLPLTIGNAPPIGAISFHDVIKDEREWSATIINRLQLVARIFANAISRKITDQNLRESERRLSMATDAAGAGLWIMDIDTKKVWVSSSLRELFNYTPEEDITYQRFFEKIHPDDHDQVRQEVEQSCQEGEDLQSDYRIILPDGNIRWINARGKRYLKPDGNPDRLMGVSVDITDRVVIENKLRDSLQEISELKQQVENENIYLQKEIKFLGEHSNIVGQSLAMKRILAEAEQVALTDSTVLIHGETGTGKEMLAQFIHQVSKRKNRPMVTINCASLPASLIESELFGREKGAYTGALTQMIGRFEIADGSTLFLDEIGELPLELQSKLLRVLEEGVFERLGSTKTIHTNVRIIAATNRNLENEVARGRFRKDLFYRLSVFPILIPPLRDRSEDIPLMVWSFVKDFKKRMGKEVKAIPLKSMESLRSYSWPGNVRELKNVIEHAMILSTNANLRINLPQFDLEEQGSMTKLEDIERQHILSILERTNWRVTAAAGILGLKRSTLHSKMNKLGIFRPNH